MREYWRGGVEAWECDEMGHMNVRFWTKRAVDALVPLAHELGLAPGARLVLRDQHIRFLKEAHAGAPLVLVGGITGAEGARIGFYAEILHHRTGEVGATFIMQLEAVGAHGQPVAPAQLPGLITIPAHGLPRSVPVDQPLPMATLEWAERAGFTRVGLAPVRHSDVDETGALYPEGFIGRVSEAVPTLLSGWREEAAAEASALDGVTRSAGAAVLEYRLTFHALPRTGDLVAVHSGIVAVADKTMTLQHWLLDPLTGQPWCVAQAVAITFDLVARKAIATPPQARARLEAMRVRLDA
jgi:acyl-CoA thioester hydrolase